MRIFFTFAFYIRELCSTSVYYTYICIPLSVYAYVIGFSLLRRPFPHFVIIKEMCMGPYLEVFWKLHFQKSQCYKVKDSNFEILSFEPYKWNVALLITLIIYFFFRPRLDAVYVKLNGNCISWFTLNAYSLWILMTSILKSKNLIFASPIPKRVHIIFYIRNLTLLHRLTVPPHNYITYSRCYLCLTMN